MTKRVITAAALVAALLVVSPGLAQDANDDNPRACSPEGTWYGANSAFQNYIFRVVGLGGGKYSIVADGFSDPDLVTYCLDSTAWHGDMARSGPRSYAFRQLDLCDPDPAFFDPAVFPSDVGLWLWAAEGEFTMTSCDHMTAYMPNVGAYLWNPIDPGFVPPVPFVDPFAVVFSDPNDPDNFPPTVGEFDRMIGP
jgi:hypothetical protein